MAARMTSHGFLTNVTSLFRFNRNDHTAVIRQAERLFAKGENAAAVSALRALGEHADPAICLMLGDCYERGVGAIQNFVTAMTWYERAANAGNASAMARLGDMYFAGRVVRVNADAPADAAIADAASLGANRLRPKGLSVPRDFIKAFHWNRKAAEAGNAEAQARLGCQYAAALGTTADYKAAEHWFAAAAEQDNAAGAFGLGLLYAGAYLGAPDEEKASIWLDKAATRGNAAAKMSLAMLLLNGKGLPADPERAAKLLREAASANQTEAMFRLGELYRAGIGVTRDAAMAETWLRRAGARGHTQSLLLLAQLLTQGSATPDYGSAAVIPPRGGRSRQCRGAIRPGTALQWRVGRAA